MSFLRRKINGGLIYYTAPYQWQNLVCISNLLSPVFVNFSVRFVNSSTICIVGNFCFRVGRKSKPNVFLLMLCWCSLNLVSVFFIFAWLLKTQYFWIRVSQRNKKSCSVNYATVPEKVWARSLRSHDPFPSFLWKKLRPNCSGKYDLKF